MRLALASVVSLLTVAMLPAAGEHGPPATTTLELRGHAQTLRLYGARGGPAAVVASGDGGWIHLGPDVAEYLSSRGWFVVGFDSKAYLSSFTSGRGGLAVTDVPADFLALVEVAAKSAARPPLLVGVSEGAGLAVLAAGDKAVKDKVAGIVALGLPDQCELAWRWRDSVIYLTKGVPREPTFSTADVIGRVAPLPVVAIHSTHDEFVPVDVVSRVMSRAGAPSQLWLVPAENHRFSGNTEEFGKKLLEATAWIDAHRR